jgi:hypothetical protein
MIYTTDNDVTFMNRKCPFVANIVASIFVSWHEHFRGTNSAPSPRLQLAMTPDDIKIIS